MTVVDVRLVPVVPGAANDPPLAELLPAWERAAIDALGFAADRDRAVTARVAARRAIARRLGVPARLVPLVMTAGRPIVEGTDVGVSWSHSGEWVALAVAAGRSVGVDIERIPEPVPYDALASIGLGSLADFVAREAAGKVTGQGLDGAWPCGVSARPLRAPAGYLAAVAAPGDDWGVDLQIARAPELLA